MILLPFLLLSSHTIPFTHANDKHVLSYPYEFIFRDTSKSWENAGIDCRRLNAELVKVHSAAITTIIVDNFLPGSRDNVLWIGASDEDKEGVWRWLDGSNATTGSGSYVNWKRPGQPDNWGNAENCACIDQQGTWRDVPCSTQRKYICQKGQLLYSNWYEHIFHVEELSWDQASAKCEETNHALVKIDSEDIANVITDFMDGIRHYRWIGASDQEQEGSWKWKDGTSIQTTELSSYKNWASSEPNGGTNANCGMVYPSGKWNDVQCSRNLKFICQKKLPVNVSREGHIYTFHRQARLGFDDARRACANVGERLLEIYDEETNEFIRTNIINPTAEFRLGGKVLSNEVAWLSETKSSYFKWIDGYPSARNPGSIITSDAGWSDTTEDAHMPYICEKLYLSEIKLSPENPTVEAGKIDAINCSGNGIPYPTVYWTDSSTNVTDSSMGNVYQETGHGFAILRVQNAAFTDESTYSCVALNKAGNSGIRLKKNSTLMVPSSPVYAVTNEEKCPSNVTVFWKPNSRAVNSVHRLLFQNDKDEKDVYETFITPTTSDVQVHTEIVQPWTTYTISVTPCLQDRDNCKTKYSVTNTTQRMIVGFPQAVTNLKVALTDLYICSVTWGEPVSVSMGYITRYRILINETTNWIYPGMQRNERNDEQYVSNDSVKYNVSGKPNSIYRIGVQAYTCAGPGDISWYKESCITEFEVSSPPEYLAGEAGNCSTNLSVVWKPSSGAVPLVHKLQIRRDEDKEVIYDEFVTPNTTGYLVHTQHVRPWTTYTISVTPCLQQGRQCETNYTLTNQTLHLSVGLPDRVTDLAVNKSNSHACYVTWAKPADIPVGYITRYKIVIDESSNEVSSGIQRYAHNIEHDLNNESLTYILLGKPKTIYRVGVQAYTCAGPGDILWYDDSCITESEGDNSAVIGGAVGSVSFLLLVIAVIIAVVLLRRKRNDKESKIAEPESPYNTIDEVIYENQEVIFPACKKSGTDIPMEGFERNYNLMISNHGDLFRKQFEELKIHAGNLQSSTEFAANPALKVKNRFKNILPYDITRVPIAHSDDGYINACFINGYQQRRKFIATQGPLKKTVNDFWLMVVEQESVVIVMLAKCVEAGKAKCEKYWPELGQSIAFGKVCVSNVNEVKNCGFVCRTFRVNFDFGNGDNERIVMQYHFLKWPDHGFPITTSSIIRMYHQAIATHKRNGPKSPIIVHCSAGAGRTGTLIAYDILLEGMAAGSADVYECIAELRSQRVEMVQNCDQYILVHKLLIEAHIFGDTDSSRQAIVDSPLNGRSRAKLISEQLSNLSRVKPMDMTQKKVEKISAYERMKVKYFVDGLDIMEPLSASFIEVYDDSMRVIVTPAPQKETAEIFYKLLFNFEVKTIVAFTEFKDESLTYWNEDVRDVTIRAENVETTPHFEKRVLTISDKKSMSTKTITHIEIKLNPKEGNDKQILKINETVTELQKEHRESGGSTVVHCKNGKGMSGVFCAVINLIERLKVEDRIDVFRTVKDLRDCKEDMVSTEVEYGLCYDAVIGYLHHFDTYSNFT